MKRKAASRTATEQSDTTSVSHTRPCQPAVDRWTQARPNSGRGVTDGEGVGDVEEVGGLGERGADEEAALEEEEGHGEVEQLPSLHRLHQQRQRRVQVREHDSRHHVRPVPSTLHATSNNPAASAAENTQSLHTLRDSLSRPLSSPVDPWCSWQEQSGRGFGVGHRASA